MTVDRARARAAAAGFDLSCDDEVGALMAALAAGVPRGGRILELGTGVGVGLAWIVAGLEGRSDVEVHSVEVDPRTAAVAATEAVLSKPSSTELSACRFTLSRYAGLRSTLSTGTSRRRKSLAGSAEKMR